MKPVHILKPARVLCGEIITVAIGIDDDIIDGIEDDTLAVLTPAQAKRYSRAVTLWRIKAHSGAL